MSKCWLAVACADHVRLGRQIGVMQVCHGKLAPLRRISPNDSVIYYSPTISFHGKDKLQSFTAIGIVKANDPYQVDMGNDFYPFRRDVQWARADEVPITSIVHDLDFTRDKKNWGYQLRYGLLAMSEHDKTIIDNAMHAQWY